MKKKKILVSQPQPSSDKSPYFDVAAKHDAEVVFRPFIKVEGLSAKEFRQSKINIPDYTAVIFTARTAVDNYFRLSEEVRFKVPDTMKYFCTTEAIARYLQKYIVYRKRKIFFGANGKLTDPQLLAAMTKNNKEKFLLPISDVHKDGGSRKDDEQALTDHKINFTKCVMYRTVSNDFGPDEPFDYDVLLFFSPSGIDSLMKNFPDFDQEKQGVSIGAFGTSTVKAVENAGLKLDFSPTPETPSMAAALDQFLKEQKKKKK